MDHIRIFCPATVSNLSCGFDVLGLALDKVGDEMTIRRNNSGSLKITQSEGPPLPLDIKQNVAGVAARSILDHLNKKDGFDINIAKRIKPGSGIGSSAASAAGAVWGINALLGKPLTIAELIPLAMAGESIASKAWHADNVAPALLGGFVLIRSYDPLDVVQLSHPKDLALTILHPDIEIKTAEARALLGDTITLQQGIRQWGNMGGLISGLASGDYELISRSLEDHIAEPKRKHLIPEYEAVVSASRAAGALGCGISGSGPSIFAVCQDLKIAQSVATAMEAVYTKTGISFNLFTSEIHPEGIRKL